MMMKKFRAGIAESIALALGMQADEVAGLLENPPKPDMGDFAFPCFTIAKAMRKPPAAIAADLASKVKLPDFASSATPAGAYLNFTIEQGTLCRGLMEEIASAGANWGGSDYGAGRVVVIDYSSPNISKHLAYHHIRSTMIGQALVRLHRACGWKTIGINHLGDWGTTFGKLMVAVSEFGGERFLESATLTDLNRMYVRFHEESQSRPGLEDDARAWFKRLEDGDGNARSMWSAFREISLKEFNRVYDRLGVKFDHVIGESFFEDRLEGVIERARLAGIAKESDGALVVDLDDTGMPPGLLRKSDGATLYLTRDIAAALYRHEKFGFDRSLYVTDAGQALHFRQLFATIGKMGCAFAASMFHVPFGVMLMGGQKGKSRKGEVVLLSDVLDEAQARTLFLIEQKNPGLEGREDVSRAVGVGAVVFNDLKNKRIKDVNFVWDEVLNLEGDSGPYVQYAHVRACGIFRKLGRPPSANADWSLLREPEEIALARSLSRFPETVERACEAFEPSALAQHLIEMSAAFHRFHHHHRVLSDDLALTDARVGLTGAVRSTLKAGLTMLGIEAPEEM